MEIPFMTVLKLFYFTYLYCLTFAASNDLGLCANPDCTIPIGSGVTVNSYAADEAGKLSFKAGRNLEIFVKDYGEKKNLLGVWLEGGKRGFVPKTLVVEKKTWVKSSNLVPALIKNTIWFGFEDPGLNDISSQASHASHLVPDQTGSYAESLSQSHQIIDEKPIQPTETLVPNQPPFTGDASSQAQFPSSGSSYDPHIEQHSSLHLTNLHLHSSANPSDFQSFHNLNPSTPILSDSYQHTVTTGDVNNAHHHYPGSGSSNTGNQQYVATSSNTPSQNAPGLGNFAHHHHHHNIPGIPGMSNVAHQNALGMDNSAFPKVPPGLDKSSQQIYFSDVVKAAEKLSGNAVPSQNNFVSNSPNHPSVNVEQVMAQFSSKEFQSQDHLSHFGNFPNKKQSDYGQPFYSDHSFGSPPVSPFPSNPLSGEANPHSSHNPGSVPDQGFNEPASNPSGHARHSSSFDQDVYDKTFQMLMDRGYGTDAYNELLGYQSDYSNSIPSSHSPHQNVNPSSFPGIDPSHTDPLSNTHTDALKNSQQNANPSFDPIIEASQADPSLNSQTDTLNNFNPNLQSSFQSSSTELKHAKQSDTSSNNINHQTHFDKASDNLNHQTSEIVDVLPNEDQFEPVKDDDDDEDDETEVEDDEDDEIENLGTEFVPTEDKNKQDENKNDSVDNLNKMDNNEPLSPDSNISIVESELPLDVPSSNVNESKEDLKVQTKADGNPSLTHNLTPQSEKNVDTPNLPPTNIEVHTSVGENLTEKANELEINGNKQFDAQEPNDIKLNNLSAGHTETNDTKNNEINTQEVNDLSSLVETIPKVETNVIPDVAKEEKVKNSNFFGTSETEKDGGVTETNLTENENSVLGEILKKVDEEETTTIPYQIRNLKENQESENVELVDEVGENVTYSEDDEYSVVDNSLETIRLFIAELMTWVPEPLYSTLMDLESKGLSPRVPVFTALCAFPCVLLIIVVVYIRETSKEKALTVKLAHIEKNVFTLSAEKTALEEKLEKTFAEFESTKNMLEEERNSFDSKKTEISSLKQVIEKANLELENNLEEINTLKEREKQFMELIKDHEKVHLDLLEEKSLVEKKLVEDEEELNELSDQLKEKEDQITMLQTEVQKFKQSNEDCEEKLSQLQKNCNQLLEEAEVWNVRVNELNSKLNEETSAKEELQNTLEIKDEEIKSLTNLVETFKSFEEMDSGNEDEKKSNEEKLKSLLDSSSVLIKLQKQEEENKLLSDKLVAEKDKILEMEVELLESRSEIDKLKVTYNQALQDKAEATTKLEVLTNYFKDKELLLQKQLGAQEAFRERREKDADSAERQIVLIEQENSSYKYQVASMKQEMEETERNLKSQIAAQEKKAHENWIAARAAERKLEDLKQETTQLRQRLTLLEREQENWVNSPRDDVIRPIPKRISGGLNDESTNGPDLNNSIDPRHMYPPHPPMMLPPDRPLPPLPPLPPFLPPMEPPPFRPPPPWHPQDPNFRMTPPDFMGPPRNRHSTAMDPDIGPLQSSPLGGSDMRDSPSHSLPDFHDIPPPPRPPFFPPPPGHHPRYPMPPQYSRRDYIPDKKRTDTQSDTSSVGHASQPPSLPQDNWSHNTRV